MWKEFRDFAMRGNVIDLAVGIIIGVAFGKIVTSLVNDILMPPLGLLLGRVDFSNLFVNLSAKHYDSLAEAKAAEYAEKLRQARFELHKAREQRVKQWNAEREAALDGARKASVGKVREARAALDAEAVAAKQAIQASTAELAEQVVRAVLPVAVGGSR